MLCFDTETWLIEPGNLTPPLVCVSYARKLGEPKLALRDQGALVVEAALDAGELLVGHNIAFDFGVCCAFRPHLVPKVFKAYREGRVRDTQIRQQLIDIAAGCLNFPRRDGSRGYKLSDLEFHYLRKDRSAEKADPNSWRMRYSELDGVPLEQWPVAAINYALEDADGTLAVFLEQFKLEHEDWTPFVDEENQNRAAWCLHLASVWGMRTDPIAVDKLEREARARYTEIQRNLVESGLIKIRKATNRERAEGKVDFTDFFGSWRYSKVMEAIRARVVAAYKGQGLAVPMTDPTASNPHGQVKTDAADTLAFSGDDLLEELGEGGPITTILKTFVPTLKQGTKVPINSRFNVLVETGRPSSSKPNLYNIPRKGGVRECFVARPGYVYCSVDLDGAELRSLAQVCYWLFDGQSELANFFRKDPHGDALLEMGAFLLEISPEEAKRRYEMPCTGPFEPGQDCLHCRMKDYRQMSKPVMYGFPGGMGIHTMIRTARRQYGVIFTEEKALAARAAWLSRWPEMRNYFAYVSKLVGMGGAQVMQLKPGGAPHRMRGNVDYCNGCNGYFQGLIADAFKEGLWRVTQESYLDESSPLYGARPLVPLYDEVFAEIPEATSAAGGPRLAEVFRGGVQSWLPDVPVTCSPALMRRWSKEAKEVFNDKGELAVWEPRAA